MKLPFMSKNEGNEKKTKGVSLVAKILAVSVVPLMILVTLGAGAMQVVGTTVAKSMIEDMLSSNINSAIYTIELADADQDQIKEIFTSLNEDTGANYAVYMNNTLAVSNSDTMVETVYDEAVENLTTDSPTYFMTINYNGETYFTYFVYQEITGDDGVTVGMTYQASITNSSVKNMYVPAMRTGIFMMLVVGIVTFFICLLINRGISKGIRSAVGNIDQVADGDLGVTVPEEEAKRGDELGVMARSVRSLVHNLGTTIHGIHDSSETLTNFSGDFKENFKNINSSIESINMAVEEIAAGANDQANETQHVSDQMTEMGTMIGDTEISLETLVAKTQEMQEVNATLNKTLQELSEISANTKEAVDEIQAQTTSTNTSANEIRAAVELITDLADQTNLLSLNASIEAANAGEYGKGFAVVANAVRELAERSGASADEIAVIVNQLITNSDHSVATMEEVLKDIAVQNERLDLTEQAFVALNEQITHVMEEIDVISGRMERLNENKDVVVSGLESLAAIAEQNAASTEETAAALSELECAISDCNESTEQLVDLAGDMTQSVERFDISSFVLEG